MKKLIIPFFLSLIFITSSFSQTVDEILAEHFNAIGQEKLLATNTFSTKGKVIQGPYEIPFISYHKKPMKFRFNAEFQGKKIVEAFNGEMGWSINELMGSTDPEPMTEEIINLKKVEADYEGIFYNYKEKGYTVEFTGKENVDDMETYVLKLTRSNGDIITYYIDSENYVLLKSESKMKMQGVETEAETIFSNYKYVNDILIAFSMETKMNGKTVMQMVFDEITYDVDIPDSMFEMSEVSAATDTTGSK